MSVSSTQISQFGTEDCAPEAWFREIESLHVGDAVWRDASWGNNAAPSWEFVDGNLVLAEAFYYTTANGERMSEHFADVPYVSVVMFDEDDNPTVAFESSPEDFLAIVDAAADRAEAPAEALVQAAEALPGEGRVYWDRDI
jgi:hypothetical protein